MVRFTGDRDRRAQRARTARRRRQRVIAAVRAVAVAVLMQQGIRRTQRRPVRMTWTLLLKDMTRSEFADRYRLSREQFDSLLQRILAKRPTYKGRDGALDCRLKLASCLRYLAGCKAFTDSGSPSSTSIWTRPSTQSWRQRSAPHLR